MMTAVHIQESRAKDIANIYDLYGAVFPDEDLVPLVSDILKFEPGVLSLIALHEQSVIGHIAFTPCTVGDDLTPCSLLAPLAVSPDFQNQGVGSGLVRTGLKNLKDQHAGRVFVLGDPGYYARFNFKPDGLVTPPYPIPAEYREAWQSLTLKKQRQDRSGNLDLPDFWLRPELWMP